MREPSRSFQCLEVRKEGHPLGVWFQYWWTSPCGSWARQQPQSTLGSACPDHQCPNTAQWAWKKTNILLSKQIRECHKQSSFKNKAAVCQKKSAVEGYRSALLIARNPDLWGWVHWEVVHWADRAVVVCEVFYLFRLQSVHHKSFV